MENKQKITIHQVIWYFVIFSVVGLVTETIYCYVTTGVLESRKGLLWGPFCPVYGIGATLLIIVLNYFKDNKIKLLIYGAIIGDIAEYIMSYCLEAIYQTRFWDYTYTSFHLNGRICLIYSVFWAILALVLITVVKPLVDKLLDKLLSRFSDKQTRCIDACIIFILLIDVLCTIWGINVYKTRAINTYYNVNVEASNSIVERLENTLFTNENMLKTFPNMRFRNTENEEVWIRDIIQR